MISLAGALPEVIAARPLVPILNFYDIILVGTHTGDMGRGFVYALAWNVNGTQTDIDKNGDGEGETRFSPAISCTVRCKPISCGLQSAVDGCASVAGTHCFTCQPNGACCPVP